MYKELSSLMGLWIICLFRILLSFNIGVSSAYLGVDRGLKSAKSQKKTNIDSVKPSASPSNSTTHEDYRAFHTLQLVKSPSTSVILSSVPAYNTELPSIHPSIKSTLLPTRLDTNSPSIAKPSSSLTHVTDSLSSRPSIGLPVSPSSFVQEIVDTIMSSSTLSTNSPSLNPFVQISSLSPSSQTNNITNYDLYTIISSNISLTELAANISKIKNYTELAANISKIKNYTELAANISKIKNFEFYNENVTNNTILNTEKSGNYLFNDYNNDTNKTTSPSSATSTFDLKLNLALAIKIPAYLQANKLLDVLHTFLNTYLKQSEEPISFDISLKSMEVSNHNQDIQIIWLALIVTIYYYHNNTELLFIANHFMKQAFTNTNSFLHALSEAGVTNIINATLYSTDNALPPSFLFDNNHTSSNNAIMITTISLGILLSITASAILYKHFKHANNDMPQISDCPSISTIPLSPVFQDEELNTTNNSACLEYSISVDDASHQTNDDTDLPNIDITSTNPSLVHFNTFERLWKEDY